ncbi:MAG: exodeoxyribonuclease VII small subunit [Bacilli bacterium]|jgi:exodeoxyribonuclease VII small subunit|nr:exodeoxyribonuclease VII small subunit [Bacillota bacterium]NLI51836.1 exodeoxyribonuclease VII small subunit [Erysipelotrichaceae bacterium]OQC09887.1 MAG: exodeoxyribonuclease VII small subunit [Tenericutes bacterium ADurb.Bin087]HOA11647.1 exodeoxyribonuclease VII small subunit [Bacilli bacterium]TAH58902.1 MAG: exodeoxyribonuclease VII small subunit [Bacillota bacterium]
MSKEKLSFEQKLARLNAIVSELESGKLSLDASLKLFEEGNALSKELATELNEAKLKIEELQGK